MSQESRTKWNTKIFFFLLLWHHFHVWSELAMPQHSMLNPGSTVSYSAVWVYPLWLASRGWSSPAILPPQDRTENLTVNSPTLQPLNHVVDEIPSQNVSIYAQGILNYQGNSKIQNLKICIDQELNWGSPGFLCHQTLYTTRPKVHISEQQMWKYKLERASSCQSYKKSIFTGFGADRIFYNCSYLVKIFTKILNTFSDSENLS